MKPFKVGIIREVREDLTHWIEGKTNLAWCTDGWKNIPVRLPEFMALKQAEEYCVGKNFLEV